ncbi:MAG: TRAP transporter small permease [Hyphomicrobiaceae bacterium]
MAAPQSREPAGDDGGFGFGRVIDGVFTVCGWIAGLILAIMAAAVFMGVMVRFAGSQAFEGLDEVPRYLFIWLVAFGGAAAMHKREHTVLDYFVNRLPRVPKAIVAIAVQCAMIAVFLYLLRLSLILVPNAALQTSPGLELRLDYVFMAVPVGAALIIIPMIRNVLELLAGLIWPKHS